MITRQTTARSPLLNRLWRAVVLVVAASVAPQAAAAQHDQVHSLTGVVTAAETGEPLAGVIVAIENLFLQTRSDSAGRFVFPRIPAGRHTLTVRMLGRSPSRHSLELLAGSAVPLHVALEIDALTLPAIEVLRRRTELAYGLDEIPGSVHVIGAPEIERENPFHDVHQSLRKIPGVNLREEEGFGLRPNIGIRGTGSERSAKITLMEDGVLIAPAPYAASSAYYFPVIGQMQAMEVRKGSSQIKYGPRTTGGAVNLLSAPIPEDLRLYVDAAGGQNATGRVSASVGNAYARMGWLGQAYRIRSDGFKELRNGNTGFDVQNYGVKLRLNNDRSSATYQELQLKMGYYEEESDETYLGLTDADFDLSPNGRYAGSQKDVMNATHGQISLRHFVRPGGRFDLTTTLYHNAFQRNWYKLQSVAGQSISRVFDRVANFPDEVAVLRGADSDPDALRVRANNRTYYAQGIQTVFGTEVGDRVRHVLEFGGRYHRDQEDRFQHEDAFQMLGGRMALTTAGAPGSQSNRVSEATALALFLQDAVSIGKWRVTPGVRYEHIDFTRTDYATDDPDRITPSRVRKNDVSVIMPGIGVSYAVRNDTRLFAGVHRGFGPPGPGADTDTRAETSVNYEVGARYSAHQINAQAVGFFSDYANMLGVATLAGGGDGSGDPFNGGAVVVRGLELSADYDPIASVGTSVTFPGRLAFTYTDAEFRSTFESDFEPWGSVERGDNLPYIPRAQLHASAGARHWRWYASISFNYSTPLRTVAGQGPTARAERTDEFVVVHASADFRLTSGTSIYLSVQNIANETYIVSRRPAGTRPGLPRTLLGGVRISSP